VADGVHHRVQRDQAGQCREPAQQRRVGQRAAQVLQRDLARRHGGQALVAEVPADVGQAQRVETAPGVDQHPAVGLEALEDVDLVQQRRVLHDQHVGREDGLAQADLMVVDAAVGHHRRTGAFRPETGKGLRMPALLERSQRQHFGGRDHPLAAAAMDADLQHGLPRFRCGTANDSSRLLPRRH
jgi:hypothetical protein